MSLTNLEIANALEEMTIRVESIVFLAGIDDPESMSGFSEAQKFMDDFDDHTMATLKPDLPFLTEPDVDDDGSFFYQFRDHGKWGFLVRVAHPVMTFTKGHEGASFSWGSYNTAWFYGESIEEILPKAEAWADALDARRKALAEAK
jgi:hypothetical protein